MRALDWARTAKHRAFIVTKKARWTMRDWKIRVADTHWAARSRGGTFGYHPEQFGATFLTRLPVREVTQESAVPNILWAFWLGPAEPNARRNQAIANLRRQPRVEVRIVTDPAEVELPDHPFHPAFIDLNPMHKSDYLRAYVMHHHGGAYADIKQLECPVADVIDELNSSPELWLAGYREVTSRHVPDLPRELGWYLKHEYRRVIGPSGFVFRPGTAFTGEWVREMHARLDYFREPLREAGWGEGSPYDKPLHYPIRWSEILGDIVQPLCLKYQDRILFTDAVRPLLRDYR